MDPRNNEWNIGIINGSSNGQNMHIAHMYGACFPMCVKLLSTGLTHISFVSMYSPETSDPGIGQSGTKGNQHTWTLGMFVLWGKLSFYKERSQ